MKTEKYECDIKGCGNEVREDNRERQIHSKTRSMKDIKDFIHLYLGCEVDVQKSIGNLKVPLRGRICEVSRQSNHSDWVKVQFDQCVTILNNRFEGITSNFHTFFINHDYIKPMLRPLSDMTEEETSYWNKLKRYNPVNDKVTLYQEHNEAQFIWLLSRSFDLFELIPAGLAIDKTKVTNAKNKLPLLRN
jgi:hypothetical protein